MTAEWAQVFIRVGQTMLIAWGIWLMRSSNQERQATSEMLREQATMLPSQAKTLDAHTEVLGTQNEALRRLLEDK